MGLQALDGCAYPSGRDSRGGARCGTILTKLFWALACCVALCWGFLSLLLYINSMPVELLVFPNGASGFVSPHSLGDAALRQSMSMDLRFICCGFLLLRSIRNRHDVR